MLEQMLKFGYASDVVDTSRKEPLPDKYIHF